MVEPIGARQLMQMVAPAAQHIKRSGGLCYKPHMPAPLFIFQLKVYGNKFFSLSDDYLILAGIEDYFYGLTGIRLYAVIFLCHCE
jgi:hypothetical protein